MLQQCVLCVGIVIVIMVVLAFKRLAVAGLLVVVNRKHQFQPNMHALV